VPARLTNCAEAGCRFDVARRCGLAREKKFVWRIKLVCPTGKSILIFGNHVKPKNRKYFAFPEGQIRTISIAILLHQEGRSRSSRNAGQGAVDAEVPTTNGADAYGEDVWS
jgi:hypothetical protein